MNLPLHLEFFPTAVFLYTLKDLWNMLRLKRIGRSLQRWENRMGKLWWVCWASLIIHWKHHLFPWSSNVFYPLGLWISTFQVRRIKGTWLSQLTGIVFKFWLCSFENPGDLYKFVSRLWAFDIKGHFGQMKVVASAFKDFTFICRL